MNLKEIRKKRNLSQNEVSELLNISQSNYSKYEKGSIEPNMETIIKLAKIFNVSADEILGITKKEDIALTEKKALLKTIEELTEIECHKLKIFADGLIANRIENNVRTIRLIKDEE